MGIALYTSRLVLEILGVSDYGVYNVVGGVIALFSFINGSMAGATSRFITFAIGENKQAELKTVFNSAFAIHSIIAVIILVLGETIGVWFLNHELVIPKDSLYAANWVFQFSIVSAIISIIQAPFMAIVMAHERMGIFAALDVTSSLLKLGGTVLLFVLPGNRLLIYGLMILIVCIIIALAYILYCVKRYNYCTISYKSVDRKRIKPMLSFSGWDLFGNISVVARTQGVNMLVNIFFTAVANAAVGIATQVQAALNGFAANVTIAMKPQIIKSYASGDYQHMANLLFRGAKLSFFIIFFISLPVLIETNFILNVWLTNVPEYTVWICRWTLIFILFSNMSTILVSGVHATGYMLGPSLINGTLYLSVVPITYIFFKNGSNVYLPFILNAGFVFIGAMANFIYTKKFVKLLSFKQFLYKVILKCVIVAGISCILPLYIHSLLQTSWFSFLAVTFVSFIFSGIIIWAIGLDNSEKQFIVRPVKNLISRFHKKENLSLL